jgi:hypothetical protein
MARRGVTCLLKKGSKSKASTHHRIHRIQPSSPQQQQRRTSFTHHRIGEEKGTVAVTSIVESIVEHFYCA